VIAKLALRSLAVRPWRTAVLAAGFGLGIAVMAALLGVGEVIIEQAHAPALHGGGDLVVSSNFGNVNNARYLLSNVVGAPEFRPRVVAASPMRRATLYLIKPGLSQPITVRGGIPSLEHAVGNPEIAGIRAWVDEPTDASWSNPRPEDVLRGMDRFHPEPLRSNPNGTESTSLASQPNSRRGNPIRGQTPASSWAEWLYFNGRTPDGRLRFYLTFLAGPTSADGHRAVIVRLQLERDGRSTNYSAGASIDARDLLAMAPELDIAGNRVRIEGARYHISLNLRDERESRPLVGQIALDAPLGRSLPPAEARAAHGWVSGYVVPVLSGSLHGSLHAGDAVIPLEGASGYHDHNWGFWEGVRWQWGQVGHDDVSIVFGRLLPPATVADPDRVPGFLGVLGPHGPIGFSSDVKIAEDGDGVKAPHAVTIDARGQQLNLRLALSVEEAVASPMPLTRLATGETMTFVQLGGSYRVTGRIGDRAVDFTARGAAETFRSNANP
jgi:hypothetical protein